MNTRVQRGSLRRAAMTACTAAILALTLLRATPAAPPTPPDPHDIAPNSLRATPPASIAGPQVKVKRVEDIPIVTKTPYDARLDVSAAVNDALARARRNGRRVLLDFGANWCPDCVLLANVMRLPEVDAFVRDHFEVVLIDVGRFDKNLEIAKRFGVKGKLEGIPSVLVLDASGRLLNPDRIAALADARSMTPQGIADCVAGWARITPAKR